MRYLAFPVALLAAAASCTHSAPATPRWPASSLPLVVLLAPGAPRPWRQVVRDVCAAPEASQCVYGGISETPSSSIGVVAVRVIDDDGSRPAGQTIIRIKSGKIISAEILLAGSLSNLDVKTVLIHEIGHALGLLDEYHDRNSPMYFQLQR
jgi:hypothetical protein